MEQEGPIGAEGKAPETVSNLDHSGVDPMQQPPPFRFLERSADGGPSIAIVLRDAPVRLLQRAWESRQLYARQVGSMQIVPRLRAVRMHTLRGHRLRLGRYAASIRDTRLEISRYGRMRFELCDLLPELDGSDVSSP